MASSVFNVKFNNGQEIPIIGLGMWKTKPGDVANAVMTAIDLGYRHFDNAMIYLNEEEVGKALSNKITAGVVKREDLFITSKLWNTFHNPDLVENACRKTLKDLSLDYLDLYLMHFPFGFAESDELILRDEHGDVVFSDYDYVDTWKSMENLVKMGLTKSIGVSNFNHEQLETLLNNASIVPVTNQVECHPYLPQLELGEWMKKRGITLTAYSSLGSPDRTSGERSDLNLMADTRLEPIAKKYNKSVAQLLIRYQIDRGFSVIPKTANIERLKENIDVFDFQLTPEDVQTLNSFDCNGRFLSMKGYGDTHKYYPFNAKF